MNKCAIVSVLAAVAVLIAFAPASDGLTCYKCSWTDPNCADDKFTDTAATEECGAAGNGTGGGAAAAAAPPADGAAAPAAPAEAALAAPAEAAPAALRLLRHKRWTVPQTATNMKREVFADEKTYYCFKVTVDKSVERGCKETDKKDDCLALDKTKYPDAKMDGCTTCTTDKCNGKSGVAAVAPAAGLALMFAMTAFNAAYKL